MSRPSDSAVTEYAPSRRCIAFATAFSSGAGSFAISAAISSLSDVGPQTLPQLADVDEVAVVAERDRARPPVLDERLRIRPLRRAGRRVAVVADRHLAPEAAELLLVEDLGDEPEVAQPCQATVLGDRDARRLLAAMLECEQPEVRKPRDVAVGGVDAEDSTHA
jgi:hypothetical protein